MGLLDFLGFGKKEKPSLNSPVARPTASGLYFNSQLRDVAKRRIGGQDLGFGEDFVSRQSSPGIAQIDTNFKERTMPLLSSQLSARGLARSAGPNLATDVINRADQQRNRDVQSMVAQFQLLNEQQKKSDFGQALQLGQNLDQQEAGLLSDAAAEGERVRDLTVGRANTNNANSLARQNQTLQALGSLISPSLGNAFQSSGGSQVQSSLQSLGVPGLTGRGPQTLTLDSLNDASANSMSNAQFEQMLAQIFGA